MQEVNIKYGILLDYTVVQNFRGSTLSGDIPSFDKIKCATGSPTNASANSKFFGSTTTGKCQI